jgi:hypothetical protein
MKRDFFAEDFLFRIAMDPEGPYSDGHKNWQRLIDTVHFLQQDAPLVNQAWFDEHYVHLCAYNRNFPDFTKIHPEITDVEFRQFAKRLEVLSERLFLQYHITRSFSLSDYLEFNETFLKIGQWVFRDDDELSELFGNLKM